MISQSIIDDTVNRLSAGETFRDIAKNLQIPVDVFYPVFRRITGKKVKELKPSIFNINDERAKAFKLIEEGASFSEAAKELGLSRQTISWWCKKAGIAPACVKKKEYALELIMAGELSLTHIAAETGLQTVVVSKIARKTKVKLPHHSRHPKYAAAVQDLIGGLGYKDVAIKYNVSNSTACRWAIESRNKG